MRAITKASFTPSFYDKTNPPQTPWIFGEDFVRPPISFMPGQLVRKRRFDAEKGVVPLLYPSFAGIGYQPVVFLWFTKDVNTPQPPTGFSTKRWLDGQRERKRSMLVGMTNRR